MTPEIPPRRRMVGTKEAAAQMNCAEKTIRKLCLSGDIPAVKVGAHWRIDLDALPGRGPATPAAGLPAELIASLVAEVVMAAEVLTQADAHAIAGVVKQAWTTSAAA
ncbi:helix-turn-helix domain-containing protein [Nocardia sp. NPDC004260]